MTVRFKRSVGSVRNKRAFSRIRACLAAACGLHGLRVIDFAVMGNHIHFVVEADDHVALSRGVQGLSVRIARALNRMLGRKGRVFDDHYDARLLRTPTELVRAIAYVLKNHEHHFNERGRDPWSSDGLTAAERTALLCVPITWLLNDGLQRAPPADRQRLAGTWYSAFV